MASFPKPKYDPSLLAIMLRFCFVGLAKIQECLTSDQKTKTRTRQLSIKQAHFKGGGGGVTVEFWGNWG